MDDLKIGDLVYWVGMSGPYAEVIAGPWFTEGGVEFWWCANSESTYPTTQRREYLRPYVPEETDEPSE